MAILNFNQSYFFLDWMLFVYINVTIIHVCKTVLSVRVCMLFIQIHTSTGYDLNQITSSDPSAMSKRKTCSINRPTRCETYAHTPHTISIVESKA